jgi:hypothetical protein
MIGCSGDNAVAPTAQPSGTILGTVTVSPANAIMAVGATLQLTVTGQSLSGSPIANFDSVQYLLQNTTDTLRVRLLPSGLLTALAPSGQGSPVLVNVVPFKDGLAKGDRAVIQITATAVSGATLSIQPVPPDSAKLAQGSNKTIVPVIKNPATGASVANPTIRYRVNPTDIDKLGFYGPVFSTPTLTSAQIYQFNCNTCTALNATAAVANAGKPWLYADVNVYGAMLHDSVQLTLTNPTTATVYVQDQALGIVTVPLVRLVPGGTITFQNAINSGYGGFVTFTFDNPAAALAATPPSTVGGSSGNVTNLSAGQTSKRRFVTPGTYTWTATVSGSVPPFTGVTVTQQIIVQ